MTPCLEFGEVRMMKARIFLLFVIFFLLLGSFTGILAEEVNEFATIGDFVELEKLPLLYLPPTGFENMPDSDLQEAKAFVDQQLRQQPVNFGFFLLRSAINEALGDNDAAIADTTMALESIEHGSAPYLTAGQVYELKAICLFTRGTIQFKLGRYQQSIDSMDQSIDAMNQLMERGAELFDFRGVLDFRGLRLNAAICNIRLGRRDVALMHCIHALDDTTLDAAENQTKPLTYDFLMMVTSILSGTEEQLVHSDQLVDLNDDIKEDPGNIEARLNRASLLHTVGANQNAQKDCEYVILEFNRIQGNFEKNNDSQDEQAQWHDWVIRANTIFSSILETQVCIQSPGVSRDLSYYTRIVS